MFVAVVVAVAIFHFVVAADAASHVLYQCPLEGPSCDGMRNYRLPHAILTVKAANECSHCKEILLPSSSTVFILRVNEERAATLFSSLATTAAVQSVLPLGETHDFYLVAVAEENLAAFESLSAKTEKQKINFTAKKTTKTTTTTNTLNLRNRPMLKNDEKEDILNTFNVNEYTTIIRQLSGAQSFTVDSGTYTITTRHSSTVSNVRAAEFIYEYLENLGYDTYYQYFRCQSGYDTQNIIGVKQGTTRADEIVVVGGHMDSTSSNTNNAPGAVDNGSGTDGMMLIAKAFQNVSLARTVHFMGFGCEEQGLIGSEYYCENSDENIVAAITMDMIGYSNNYYGVMIEGLPNADVQNLMNLMQENVETYSPELTTTSRNFSFGSDHVSFQNCGIPAFLAIEQDETDYNCYHSTCDSSTQVNSNQGTDIARACGGVLYDVAKEI